MGTGAGTRTTAGTRSAADGDRIAVLRRRVYGPSASAADVAALAEALTGAVAPPPAPVADTSVPTVAAALPGAGARRRALPQRVPPRLAAIAAGVAVLGGLAGAGTAALANGIGPAAPHSEPRFVTALTATAPADVLDRPGAAGHPAALVGPDLVSSSFRRLASYSAAGVTFWAARDRFGQTCLVVADTYYRTACADRSTFTKDGLVVVWSAGPGYPVSTTESYTALWGHGRLAAGRTAS